MPNLESMNWSLWSSKFTDLGTALIKTALAGDSTVYSIDFLEQKKHQIINSFQFGHYCADHYVEIRDGGDLTSTRLGNFCVDNSPNYVKSTGNQLFVKFFSDGVVPKRGFSALFKRGKK